MKLAEDALIQIIEFLRQGLMEQKDVSDLLKSMELEPNSSGKLGLAPSQNTWKATED